MINKSGLDTERVVGALTVAGLAAAVFYLVLSLISQPSNLGGRLAQVDQQTEQVERVLGHAPAAGPYVANPICDDATAGAAVIRQQVQSAANNAGLALSNFSTSPGPPDEALGGLQPLTLTFEADGRYDAVVGLLGALAKSQPQIFVDKVDLNSQTSSAALKLSGRIYCSTTAPL